MKKPKERPKIDVAAFHGGNATIFDVYGKVYAQIFRECLSREQIAPLPDKRKADKLKSS
jgi:hypothetical protein